ncbi:MAG: metallophosphoesterase family protein [Chloroflexi bacterium]|nr:metallophosphoesterase family protein [Chloroflexota bacterium]
MRIATFSDVHSNRHALEAVLGEIDKHRPDRVYCLGDLVGYGAYPNEVIELIRQRNIPTVMGNYDDGVGFDKDECGCAYTDPELQKLGDLSFKWTKQRVTPGSKVFLRSLLPSIRFEAEGKRVLLVHGSPRKINEYLYEDRGAVTLERMARLADADVLAFGHTHMPYVKTAGGVVLVNNGSVGKPRDGDPRAAYALIDIGPEINATIHRVAYDVTAAAAAVRLSGLPPHFADLLETAT